MAEIIIPGQFQQYSTSGPIFITDAGTVSDALSDLTHAHPMLKPYIFDPDNEIKGFVNIFVDGKHAVNSSSNCILVR